MALIHEAIIERISTLKDGTLKYTVVCNQLTEQQMTRLFSFNNQFAKVLLSDKNISREIETEVDNLELEERGNKSKGQSLRGCLYRLWEQNNSGFETFTLYYNDRMERIINQVKGKLS